MSKQATDVLSEVTNKTSNDLIYFFIILAVVILIIGVPLYTLTMRENREKRKQALEAAELQAKREEQYMKVIQHNTEVNSELKTMLEMNNNNCIECKYDHQEKMELFNDKLDAYNDRLISKIDSHNDKLVEVGVLLKQIIPMHQEAAPTKEQM